MEEKILKIFAESTTRYFATVSDGAARLGTPYLREEAEDPSLDFAAVIGISGHYRGRVCYTATREKLHALLPLFGETDIDEQLYADLVGEITNTISGNARESLGSGFMISPPVLVPASAAAAVAIADAGASLPCYVLPVTWKDHHSRVLVTLQPQTAHKPAPDAT